MSDKYYMTWEEAQARASRYKGGACYGIPRGGLYVAAMLGKATDNIQEAEYIVDDITDSGKTAERWLTLYPDKKFFSLVDKTTVADSKLGWVVFPWEAADNEHSPTDAVRRLLEYIGEDCNREGLLKTPQRVVKAYDEMLDGYTSNIDALFTTFDGEGRDQIIAVKDISFVSMCEHHMLPFTGLAHVAYLPVNKVIGASKIPRLVAAFAHRLQIQERLTEQVASTLMDKLQPAGVAVIIQATHECMRCRGIKCATSKLVTSVMLGEFRNDVNTKQEVLALLGIIK